MAQNLLSLSGPFEVPRKRPAEEKKEGFSDYYTQKFENPVTTNVLKLLKIFLAKTAKLRC